ncbi:MAG: OpgC domain-containing protein [Bradyrhizobium sp.]|uniref:OpgC domain-containing protein n=1 Tax=Bradyrhizobium sp. TaxID=376 RepID=UPI001C28297D|nr:OpgC domain-containing protein [Bradyrhizobium sp.]MBU6464933.1 OpgC domain-containing protein [Pseudomonadota bacterium]MDE2066173.1 OpgC domain-containing protein [Bradyrhizobium sp.]MDE2243709.1 OpgC domain-containing protein [Bradyrhizobium sp.]MDE2468889.1 OpgC domain-containing protein [Bradyrhizobium sp.]
MSIADQIAGSPQAGATVATAVAPPRPVGFTMAASLPAVGQRELRLDLFRGLALWLIYIDHVSPDLLSWFTIRSYGFSDAAEIFIFISGYTAAFVYGRSMLQSGFVVAAARVLRRAWQIYAMHILLFMLLVAEVSYIAVVLDKPFYAKEMEIIAFLDQPGHAMAQALLLRYRPLNMDVLPLYIVLMAFLPLILLLMKWRPNLTLALSIGLYALCWHYDLHLSAYPDGFWSFNPFAWQMLFVFGAWCALGRTTQMSRLMSSPVTMWIALAYLLAAFYVTLSWYFPPLAAAIPHWLEQWMYPIDKTDLDVLRFAHFLALAAITVHFVPAGWPGLNSLWLRPMVLCGQHSLEIFALGVFLAFTGYFVLMETSAGLGLHILIGLLGIAIMSAVAWLLSWYKRLR